MRSRLHEQSVECLKCTNRKCKGNYKITEQKYTTYPRYTTRPDKSNLVFLYLVTNDASVRYCTVVYSATGQVRFYKVQNKHGHVYLVTLYTPLPGPFFQVLIF